MKAQKGCGAHMNIKDLKKSILELEMCEAKYYLLHLCHTFKKYSSSLKNNDAIIEQTALVVKDIQRIMSHARQPEFHADDTRQKISG